MNIREAKKQIENAMKAYFTTDEYGNFLIPPEEQRPVFLVGPPGIGKTAIMKQIADEMNVGLVSYSMTHHTRQSALGLPMIVHKNFDGKDCAVTEYTMSEIISSIYDMMEETGCKRGILFLDEINCISETLTPTMLQFLQYKTFGAHKVPEGWIVVTAGNPPEYNRAVREFDVVTYDRLKRVDVEPDYAAWKEYAFKKGAHPAILTYLDARKDHFYSIETDVDGKKIVTARAWLDLSDMMHLYEKNGIEIDKNLISQYIQNPAIAEEFAIYYDIFNKYKSDYQIDAILDGSVPAEIMDRARQAPFDEKLSLIGLMLDAVGSEMKALVEKEDGISMLLADLKAIKAGAPIEDKILEEQDRMARDERRGILTPVKRHQYDEVIAFLDKHRKNGSEFSTIETEYKEQVSQMMSRAKDISAKLENLFAFAQSCWGNAQEMLIILTELTINCYAARFIARYGSEAYDRLNKELMFYERDAEIARQIELLGDL